MPDMQVWAEGSREIPRNSLGGGLVRQRPVIVPTATCHARLGGADRSVCGRDLGDLSSIPLTWGAVTGGSFSPDLQCARCRQALQRDATEA